MQNKAVVNLTTGSVWKTLFLYCLPLFGSALVQQLYSLADLLVVGNFAREGALAVDAIGNATVVINVLLAFALGANGGCSVIVAKRFGADDRLKIRETVYTSLVSFAVLCAVLMITGFTCSRLFLNALNIPPSYFDGCLEYLFIYTGSLPFVFLYNLGCGICSALGDSKTPFIFLVISSVLNIGLDLIFVCVLHLDVAGAAWATLISQAVSCVLTAIVLVKKLNAFRTPEKAKIFDFEILKDLAATSIPIILQQSFISVGNFFINSRINSLGEDATTGFTTAFKLICMSTMSIVSMTNGMANYAAQNKAAGKIERVKQGFAAALLYALAVTALFLIFFVTLPKPLTGIFIQPEKLTPEALEYSAKFLFVVAWFMPVVCVKIMADGTVRGLGGNMGFLISTFSDLVLRVALVYLLTDAGWGFAGVYWAWAIGWVISTFIALGFFFTNKSLRTAKNKNGGNQAETP